MLFGFEVRFLGVLSGWLGFGGFWSGFFVSSFYLIVFLKGFEV